MMNLSGFVDEELQRVEEIKKDKTLQAMIQTRDELILRLKQRLAWWKFLSFILAGTILLLLVMLLK